MSIKIVQGGAQWLSICLAYIIPWVPSPVPKKKKKSPGSQALVVDPEILVRGQPGEKVQETPSLK
jgi:hypothetical protein